VNPLDSLKLVGGPGSIGFLIATTGIALFVARVWPRRRRLGHALVALLIALYVVMSLPVVSQVIVSWLPPVRAEQVPGGSIDTLVVLDGDNRRGRLREGLRVWKEVGPRELVVSGSAWLPEHFVEEGVPGQRLLQDVSASNTREQIVWLAGLIAKHPSHRIALIASTLQMPRVDGLVRWHGLNVALVPSPIDAEPPASGWLRWVPSYAALRISRDALYEVVALEYYERRGWIGAAGRTSSSGAGRVRQAEG
jgi:uncharacterized SAM-binding protein YcdF (DUF218 family)